ncbi:choice-of-anchor Q domain-containing protein [Arenicella xantha]|uniref:Putative outer membrane repeat protein n=1 Tax=Arenicella xantha TaxID=644221 RepID=A0A395JN17_9GAMM|nr:choice-of-anchor Q domain-containing protein [Arenicella xantha]RBP52867.1 putative outer membrane repeat protein [Arenicella xantha]
MPPLNNFQKSCIALAVGQALIPTNLRAATITVDAPGSIDECNLYDAIASANTDSAVGFCVAGSGADTIELYANARFVLDNPGTEGLLINSAVTINGNNSIITRDTATLTAKRLIDIAAGAVVTINDLALDEGLLQAGDGGGAGIRVTDASLTLNNSSVTDNRVNPSDPPESGGGILASGSHVELNYVNLYRNSAGIGGAISLVGGSSLTVTQSSVKRNSATYHGGAIHTTGTLGMSISGSDIRRNTAGYSGGAISSVTDTTIASSYFSRNRAGTNGGAIIAGPGPLVISDSNFTANEAYEQGGAIDVNGSTTFSMDKTALSDNFIGGEYGSPSLVGGAAIALSASINSSNTISNSTVSGNLVRANSVALYGGAILLGGSSLSIVNSTIVGGEGGEFGPDAKAEGIFAYDNSSVALINTVISKSNFASIGGVLGNSYGGELSLCDFEAGSSLSQNINNFFSDESCDGVADGDAKLSRLKVKSANDGGEFAIAGASVNTSYVNYGRATQTVYPVYQSFYMPLFGSPLLNAGDVTVCGASPVSGFDQRGQAHSSGACDIGSIDVSIGTLLVDNTGDEISDAISACTLRDALISTSIIGGEGGEGGEIPRTGSTCDVAYDLTNIRFDSAVFPPNGSSMITLGDELPIIVSAVSVQGPSQKVGALSISGNDGVQVMRAYNADLQLSNLTISNGSSGFAGGGIAVYASALTLSNVMVSNNTATQAGAGLRISYQSTASLTNTTVSANYLTGTSYSASGGEGAGISAAYFSRLIIDKSTISSNSVGTFSGTVGLQGGGIALSSAAIASVRNSTISGNRADNGGGVYVTQGGEMASYNSTISNNYAMSQGGGVNVVNGGELFVLNSIVSGNRSGLVGKEVSVNDFANTVFFGSILGEASNTYVDSVFTSSSTAGFYNSDTSFVATSDVSGGAPNPDATALRSIIGPLRNNGGRTFTHNLVNNSPAIDAGQQFLCGGEFDLPRDQRDFYRNDGACDIGSIEYVKDACFVVPIAGGKAVVFCL